MIYRGKYKGELMITKECNHPLLEPGHDIIDLVKLALSGDYTPADFVIAAYNIPGYDPKIAAHIGEQYFNSAGWPISDTEAQSSS